MAFSVYDNPEILEIPRRLRLPHSWVGHIPAAFHLVKLLQPKIIVELGVHIGNSFSALCQAVTMANIQAACYGVDTWQGDKHAGFYDDSIYSELLQDISAHYSEFAHLLRQPFDEALSSFSEGSVDLLHIDGLHTFEAVLHDFETWLPKLSDRGVVMFHDVVVRSEDFGVWKLWEDLRTKYPACHFVHGFGLGILAVGKNVPAEVLEFIEAVNTDSMYQKLFGRLGNSLCWLTEREDALRSVQSFGGLPQLRERIRELELMLSDYGLKPKLVSQISLDLGSGFTEELTGRIEVSGKENSLSFDVSNLTGSEPVKFARIYLLNCPVAVRIEQLEVIDENQNLHTITNFNTNQSFVEEGVLGFDTDLPEISADLSAITKPQRIIVRLEFLAFGANFTKYMHERLKQALHNAGLVISEMSGQLTLVPRFAEHLAQKNQSPAQPQRGGAKQFDEKLLATAMFLHEELRAKDAIIQRKNSELTEKERELQTRESSLSGEMLKLQSIEFSLKSQLNENGHSPENSAELSKLRDRLLGIEYFLGEQIQERQDRIDDLQVELQRAEQQHSDQLLDAERRAADLLSEKSLMAERVEDEIRSLRSGLENKEAELERLRSALGIGPASSTELIPVAGRNGIVAKRGNSKGGALRRFFSGGRSA